MVTSSLSLSISFRCFWSLWHLVTVPIAFWQNSCRQAVFNINRQLWCYNLSIKIDVFCSRNISWKLFNQAFKLFFFSKISQLNIGLTFSKPARLKTVNYCFLRGFTPSRFYPRDCFENVNFLHYVCCFYTKSRTSKFSYDTWVWNFWCSLHLTAGAGKLYFFGKNRTLMLEYCSLKLSG